MGILSEIDMMNRDAEDDAFEVSSDSETVSDVVYRDGFSDALDETQTKTHRILRVQKEDVSFLLEKNATMAMLKKYQPYVAINLCSRKALFQWKIDNKVAEIPTDVFRYMTAEKFMRYMV